MAGSDTLAIDVSSTFMNVAAERASVPHMRALPSSGGGARGVVWVGEDMEAPKGEGAAAVSGPASGCRRGWPALHWLR
ncbi:hypothetical protein AVXHC19_04170 [Acidovorax sacchari]